MAELDTDNMVLNDIEVSLITNDQKTGVFDVLMASVNEDINNQFLEGRINNNEFASVYLGSIQTVLAQSIQFVLQEQLSEAQISAILKDNALKDEQRLAAYTERVIKDKQAAKLGMDNVMKTAEEERSNDPDYIYTPKYVQE